MTRWDAIKTKFLLLSKGEKLIFAFIVSFIVSLLPAGFFAAFMVGEWSAGLLRMLRLSVTTSYGLAIALIFAFALTFVAAMVFRKNMDLNGAKEIDDRGMITSNAGTYGTAEWMSEAEAKQVYEVGPVEKVTGTILGQFTQEGEEVIALPFEPTGNRNLILIGPPGSGKSFGYVRTAVFQSIVRGESVVVTDPKGEIHNDMRKLLEANGYKVKVFNLINLDLSNAWDCVQEIYDPITGNIDDQRVITFCKTVITNTGGGAGGDPFWESSEENLFRVAVSYCAFMRETTLIKIYERRTKELLTQLPFITEEDGDKLIEIVKNPESAMFDRRKVVEYLAENFYGKEEGNKKLQSWEDDAPTCNISDIYNALLHNDLNSWEDNFKNVPLNHPAASAWAVFKGMGERVQPNIVGGLNTRLQLFMTYKVRRVISNDDIRLANIGAEKTALFLIISDDNASILNPLITGSMACYNRPTNVDLKAKYIVFDFNGMKGAILTMSMFVVLDFVWTKIKEDRKKRKAVFIDECWKLIGTDSNEMAAEDVVEIFRTIRAYGGSAFAMTQDISQFYEYKGGKYGKAIIGNADTKIIMHLIPSEAQALQAAIQLTDAEMENVSSLQRGQGLVCSSSAKLFVDFVAADYEKQEITTDAKSFYMQEKALKEKQHQEEQARLEVEDKKEPAKTDDNSEKR